MKHLLFVCVSLIVTAQTVTEVYWNPPRMPIQAAGGKVEIVFEGTLPARWLLGVELGGTPSLAAGSASLRKAHERISLETISAISTLPVDVQSGLVVIKASGAEGTALLAHATIKAGTHVTVRSGAREYFSGAPGSSLLIRSGQVQSAKFEGMKSVIMQAMAPGGGSAGNSTTLARVGNRWVAPIGLAKLHLRSIEKLPENFTGAMLGTSHGVLEVEVDESGRVAAIRALPGRRQSTAPSPSRWLRGASIHS